MKSRLNKIRWTLRIASILLFIGGIFASISIIKYLEPSPLYISQVSICESEQVCNSEDFNQGTDNLFIHIDTKGDWENETIIITGVYILNEKEYEILTLEEEIKGDTVVELEKDLKNGWLIGPYYIEISIENENSNVIHTTFDIMPGS